MTPLVDCHSHLAPYDDDAVAAMLTRAAAAGVGWVVCAGVDLPSSERAVALAERCPGLLAAVGLHPTHLRGDEGVAELRALAALAQAPRVVALSEVGLDGVEARAPLATQRHIFAELLRLAADADLPVIYHDRAAGDDALALLVAEGLAERAVRHYFVGGPAEAAPALAAGVCLSLGKPLAKADAAYDPLREVARCARLDRLLLETDTYPLPGRTTEPADARQVAGALAALRGLAVADVAAATTATFARLAGARWTALQSWRRRYRAMRLRS
ncbi:MAG: TatD family hydrolase [Chloroflexi bacterium]|nr:TatD family hydrolase [Chloroflexota bacterium]